MNRLLFVAALLLGVCCGVQAEEDKDSETLFSKDGVHLTLQHSQTDSEAFLIELNARDVKIEAFQLRNPNRLVIDAFTDTGVKASRKVIAHPVLKQVRVGSHSDKIRFVFDLRTGDLPEYGEQKAVGQLLLASSSFNRKRLSKKLEAAKKKVTGTNSRPQTQKPEGTKQKETRIKESGKADLKQDVQSRISFSSKALAFIHSKRPIQNIRIKNEHEVPISMKATACELLPAEDGDARCLKTNAILISPQQVEVEASGTKTLRVVLSRSNWEDESLYRISFLQQGESPASSYRLIATALPKDPKPEIEWALREGELLLKNTGNTHVEISNLQLCSNKGECLQKPDQRLYQESQKTYPVANFTVARFTKSYSDMWYEQVEIPISEMRQVSKE